MKITPIKIAAVAFVFTSLSFASCKSAGYGCDYGAIESTNLYILENEVCLDIAEQKKEIPITYIKISDASE